MVKSAHALRTMLAVAAVCGLPLSATWAHHSFAQFDRTKTMVLTITVVDWQYTPPHCWLDGLDKNGAMWSFEGADPVILSQKGLKKKTLRPGDKVIVTTWPLHDGRNGGSILAMQLPDGRRLDIFPRTDAEKAADPPVDRGRP